MKPILPNSSLSLKRLNLYAAHLVVFLIPFEQKPLVWALLLFCALNLITYSWSTRVHYYKKRALFIWLFSLYFFAHLVSLIHSNDTATALKDLESKLSLLLIPWVILTCNIINKYTLLELLKTFVYGVVGASVISFIYAGLMYLRTENIYSFYYAHLSYYHHVGYFALYVNFAISILIVFIIHHRNKIRILDYVLLAFLIITVYQLSSRMGIIVMSFLIAFGAIYLAFPKIRYKNPALAFGLVILISGIFIYVSTTQVDRFKSVKTELTETKTQSSSGSRLLLWQYSLDLVKEKPFLGYGTGDIKKVLMEKWESEEFYYALKKELNPHNQFLQTTLSTGILGLLCLLGAFFVPLKFRKRHTNILYVLFIMNILMNAMTESILERQDGIIFYALFNVFLYFTYAD